MDLSICNWPIDIGWIVSAMGVSSGFTSSSKMDPILYMVFEIGMHTSTMPSQLEILGSGYIQGQLLDISSRDHCVNVLPRMLPSDKTPLQTFNLG